MRNCRNRAPNSGVKTNVVLVYFIIASLQVCIQYRIQAASQVFKPICLWLVALGVRLETQSPTGGAA